MVSLLQEEIAALNLAKFRKAQQELEEAEERADLIEQAIQKLKSSGRSSSKTRGSSPIVVSEFSRVHNPDYFLNIKLTVVNTFFSRQSQEKYPRIRNAFVSESFHPLPQ